MLKRSRRGLPVQGRPAASTAEINNIHKEIHRKEQKLLMFKFNAVLMNVVKHDLENKNIPMLLGEPGIGKSSWVEDLAKLMNTRCFTLACNQLADKADLTGARLVPCGQDANGETMYKQVFYPHAVIQEACAYASANPREYPILFLDEINRTTPDVTSELLSIPTMRKIGSVSLPNNLRVVTAGNDKGNITSLDDASITRFVLYDVVPDKDTFIQVNSELNEFIRRVLNAHPEVLFCKALSVQVAKGAADDDDSGDQTMDLLLDACEEMNQTTTPRTLSALSRWLNSYDNKELQQLLVETVPDKNDPTQTISVLQAAIEGHVGRTDFSQLLTAEIANGITTIQSQANVASIQKPPCYDMIKACPDMNALNALIAGLAKNELAATAAYMLTENLDNKAYINQIMPCITSADLAPHYPVLMAIAQNGGIDSENLQTAVNSADQSLSPVLSMLMQY